jgi:hypothetical protein
MRLIGYACLLVALTATLAVGATITSVQIGATNPGGSWWTGFTAAIGISDPGGVNNPFYNDLATGAILPPGIPSGTYLGFLGYEDRWPGNDGNIAILTLHYSDNSSRAAEFLVGSITATGSWTRLSGDSGLTLGGGGFDVTPDRVGTSGSTNIVPTDDIPDVVLMFSDSGTSVPEPGTLGLAGGAVVSLWLLRRRRARSY